MHQLKQYIFLGRAMLVASATLSIFAILILAYPFMRLWNFTVVPVKSSAALTYFRAFGLLILATIVKWAVGGVPVSGEAK
ncbi:MAG TPA: hypothetical protein VG944_15130 [Fimbriimonas sp.]|nr:hypothetical protein [Fimbriimonas sp.]